jgi:hypothetical protein
VGSLTSHNPIGLHGLLRDSFILLSTDAKAVTVPKATRVLEYYYVRTRKFIRQTSSITFHMSYETTTHTQKKRIQLIKKSLHFSEFRYQISCSEEFTSVSEHGTANSVT